LRVPNDLRSEWPLFGAGLASPSPPRRPPGVSTDTPAHIGEIRDSAAPRRTGARVTFSTFWRKTDNRPQRESLSWTALTARLTHHLERRTKDGPMFSPATFKSGTARANANVLSISMLVADLDGNFDWIAIQERIEQYAYVAYSTYNSTADHPKLRVVIPLSTPITSDQWRGFWERANEHLFLGAMDRATKAVSEAYYFPACPAGAPRVELNHG
jgi:putative DNA primase/helicase